MSSPDSMFTWLGTTAVPDHAPKSDRDHVRALVLKHAPEDADLICDALGLS